MDIEFSWGRLSVEIHQMVIVTDTNETMNIEGIHKEMQYVIISIYNYIEMLQLKTQISYRTLLHCLNEFQRCNCVVLRCSCPYHYQNNVDNGEAPKTAYVISKNLQFSARML